MKRSNESIPGNRYGMLTLIGLVLAAIIITCPVYGQVQDSTNVRFVGNWPFGASYAVAYDSVRSLGFCGSGGGVYILALQDPSNPVKLSEQVHTRGIVKGLFYRQSDSMLYIAAGSTGLEIWDIKNPSSPTRLGKYDTPGYAYAVSISGSYAYVADDNDGLQIYKFTGNKNFEPKSPGTRLLLITHPNPFNFSTTVRYQLPTDSRVLLTLSDFSGRTLKVLEQGNQKAGIHTVHWDGNKANPLPAGIYFLRLKAGEYTECRKIAKLR